MASRLYPASCILYRLLFLLFLVLPDKDMPLFFPGLLDLQDLLTLVLHALGHILDRRLVIENDLEDLAEVHLLDGKFGTYKGIRADLAFEIDGLVDFDVVGHEIPPESVRSHEFGVRRDCSESCFYFYSGLPTIPAKLRTPNSQLRTILACPLPP